MCQFCVTEGHMSQEELDERITNGDLRAMPLMDLPMDMVVEQVGFLRACGLVSDEGAMRILDHIRNQRAGEVLS